MTTKDRHKGRIASIGCVLCRELLGLRTPAELHHIREDQGLSKRASDFLVVPLCTEHHRGQTGFHGLGRRAFEQRYKLTELDLLALTIMYLTKGE